jgi:hypothetical protein
MSEDGAHSDAGAGSAALTGSAAGASAGAGTLVAARMRVPLPQQEALHCGICGISRSKMPIYEEFGPICFSCMPTGIDHDSKYMCPLASGNRECEQGWSRYRSLYIHLRRTHALSHPDTWALVRESFNLDEGGERRPPAAAQHEALPPA